jgi:hypothetical protein
LSAFCSGKGGKPLTVEDYNMSEDHYVYALKDPRKSPALPFYVGKGTGTRAYDHVVRVDDSPKGDRIRAIAAAGKKVVVTRLVDGLSEAQALKLEAELIAAFGVESAGGLLTNSVLPKGLGVKQRAGISIPSGSREKAQIGLTLIKDAVLELAKANHSGVSNSDVASLLGLRSDYGGGSKDYLSYSILGLLMREGKIARLDGSRRHVAGVQ